MTLKLNYSGYLQSLIELRLPCCHSHLCYNYASHCAHTGQAEVWPSSSHKVEVEAVDFAQNFKQGLAYNASFTVSVTANADINYTR